MVDKKLIGALILTIIVSSILIISYTQEKEEIICDTCSAPTTITQPTTSTTISSELTCGTVTQGFQHKCCRDRNRDTPAPTRCPGSWYYNEKTDTCDYECHKDRLTPCDAQTLCEAGNCIILGGTGYCLEDDACDFLGCQDCRVMESYPLQISCGESEPHEEFCGSSSKAKCEQDSDCKAGGCSGQLCEGIDEMGVTICDMRDCYNAGDYGYNCACNQGACQWTQQTVSNQNK